ncbi:MAG: 30S ribosomal protein S12 methylthiotransferase RimO [Desulfosoma sp.]|uniref:30S ribosomal protein S12 methylthiotransferase RimO n=1 Tax=Desulfosoma sp. TaxID=2603217 RepID=UPI00404B1DE7
MQQKAAVVSLGCAKNLVDSEVLAAQLTRLGYEITAEASEAALIVVNTCGFLESAVQEAVDHLLEMARYKDEGSCRHLVAVGCMVQRYGRKLVSLLPEVDLFLGTSHYDRFADLLENFIQEGTPTILLERPGYLCHGGIQRIPSTPAHWAYVKIAEGCSNRCSFCLIPALRGPCRSRTVQDVVAEVQHLAQSGVVEVNLIAQDTTAFGTDRGEPNALCRLLEALEDISGLRWVRLLYTSPFGVHDDLLRTMAGSSKVVPYLDIPFQHCVPRILEAMHRRGKRLRPLELIERIRKRLPDVALRTSLMVGFPGETEADFQDLCRFIKDVGFDHMGVFAFSSEKGCRAARLPNPVAEEVKQARRDALMALQQSISRAKLQRLVGRRLPILVEGLHSETEFLAVGRLPTQAPEVDGCVLIVEGEAVAGNIVQAEILKAHDYDLEARLLTPAAHGP